VECFSLLLEQFWSQIYSSYGTFQFLAIADQRYVQNAIRRKKKRLRILNLTRHRINMSRIRILILIHHHLNILIISNNTTQTILMLIHNNLNMDRINTHLNLQWSMLSLCLISKTKILISWMINRNSGQCNNKCKNNNIQDKMVLTNSKY